MSYAPPPERQDRQEQAAAQPGRAAPQYSADGRWYWDGQQWRPVAAPGPMWARPYGPPESRAAAAVALVALAIAGAALSFVGEAIDLLAALVAPGSIVETIGAGFQIVASLASMAGLLGSAIALPMWMHRSFRNLPALGATGLSWSPAWAAGGWFIPLANLVIPYLVTRELWIHASGEPERVSPLLPLWWGAWVGAYVLHVLQGASNSVGRTSRVGGDVLGILNDVGLVLAGALLIVLVQRITRRQRARHAQLLSA